MYTTVGGTTRTHDNNGNLTDDGTYLFGYDFQNRLVELKNKSTSAVIATYRYDALGRRVEKAVAGGATTRYLLDGVQVVEEYDGTATWQARYVYEDGIDRPRSMDRADIADVNGNANTTEVLRFHYHSQALGSVTEMTQPTGAVVEWVVYDVYGQPTIRDINGTVITQSAVGNPYLYTGREFDPESGLFFYRARHYDPAAGRFLQRDPWKYASGLDYYEYCQSSPCVLVDAHGLFSFRDDLPLVPDPDAEGQREGGSPAYTEEEIAVGKALDAIRQSGPDWAKEVLRKHEDEIRLVPRWLYSWLVGTDSSQAFVDLGPFGKRIWLVRDRCRLKRSGGKYGRLDFLDLLSSLLHELLHWHVWDTHGVWEENPDPKLLPGGGAAGETTEDVANEAAGETMGKHERSNWDVPWSGREAYPDRR